jgi:hypothetical protein
MKITCTTCGIKEEVTLLYHKKSTTRQKVFLNTNGKKWYAYACPSCVINRDRKRRGWKPRSTEHWSPTVSKAVWAEELAQKKFESLGMVVDRTKYHGPDLICKIGDWVYTVEVKRARKPTRSNTWVCDLVYGERRKDDLIAIVMPNGHVCIDDMNMHLAKCMKNGQRTISKLVKQFGLTPLPTPKPTT